MTLTIGRVGLDVSLNNPSSFTLNGGTLNLSGPFRVSSVADMKVLRQQLSGYVDNRWEPIVPVTWSLDSTVDGWYRVLDASIDVPTFGYRNGFASFDCTLQRVQGFSSAWAEANLAGADRAGIPGGVTASTWHALPSTATAVTGSAYSATRTGPSGSALVATSASTFYDSRRRFYLAPANWYDMASTLKVGGNVVVGRQITSLPSSWELSNGLMKVTPNGTSSTLLDFTPLANRAGASYGTATGIKVGYFSGTTLQPVTTASSITAMRVSPEECVIRLLCTISAFSDTAFTVDIGLRRGSLFATVTITGDSNSWGIQTAASTACTSQTGGFYATSGGNKTLVVSSAKTFTTDLTGPTKLYLTSAGTQHDMAIGHTDESAPGATAPDRRTDLRDQFFAAITETQAIRLP